jgi:hypothetical protein
MNDFSFDRDQAEPASPMLPVCQPFTPSDLQSAKLNPPCIVENYLYADLALINAAGGTGKTTMQAYEAICIALGRDVWGCRVIKPGATVFVTAEDSRDLFAARIREICYAMSLTTREISVVCSRIIVWDVSGTGMRLSVADRGGNLVLTEMADSIVAAYQGMGVVQIVFDPAISFGPGERFINDGEQQLVDAARRIVRGLGCAVRYIHHTGKANARSGAVDQYAGRGGTALPDGSRMVTILSPITGGSLVEALAPDGFELKSGESGFILARPKLSYVGPQPNIWIKRRGFSYEYWYEGKRSQEDRLNADAEKVSTFLKEEFFHGRKYTANNLDQVCGSKLSLSRTRLRSALALLDTTGRVVLRDLPTEERVGRRKTFLSVLFHSAEASGGIDPETDDFAGAPAAIPPTSIIPPPYRKRKNGGIDAAFFSSVSSYPPNTDGGIAAEWRNSQIDHLDPLEASDDEWADRLYELVEDASSSKSSEPLKVCRMEEGFHHGD